MLDYQRVYLRITIMKCITINGRKRSPMDRDHPNDVAIIHIMDWDAYTKSPLRKKNDSDAFLSYITIIITS